MLYKEKILLIHRNSILREQLSSRLRENNFAVILANNIENVPGLVQNMQPDLVLWGETLTASSKSVIRNLKKNQLELALPIIAMLPDVELFDRIEFEKLGINDIIEASPNFTDLKIKIRSLLNGRRQFLDLQHRLDRAQGMAELQNKLIQLQDPVRVIELTAEYIHQTYRSRTLLTLLYNPGQKEYDHTSCLSREDAGVVIPQTIFEHPVWEQHFFSRPKLRPERIINSTILDFLSTIGLSQQITYQFPLAEHNKIFGLLLIGVDEHNEISSDKMDELILLTGTLTLRLTDIRNTLSGQPKLRERTAEIRHLFQRLDENDVFDYLSRQVMQSLEADLSLYLNYNEGFRFLYPQYCYKAGSDRNIFENEKPPVLMLREFPVLEKFAASGLNSLVLTEKDEGFSALQNLSRLVRGSFSSLVTFRIRIGAENNGFLCIGYKNGPKKINKNDIAEAEQAIHRATEVLVESRIIRQAQQTLRQLDRVFELSKELTLDHQINDLLNRIASSIRKTLGWNIVLIDQVIPGAQQLNPIAALGLAARMHNPIGREIDFQTLYSLEQRCFSISHSFLYSAEHSQSVLTEKERRKFLLNAGQKWHENDWLIIPIRSRGAMLGYITVNDPVEQVRPSEDKVRSLEYFANQAAVALENAALYDRLKTSEQRYRLLAETMPLGLFTCEDDGKIFYVNQSLTEILRYGDAQALSGISLFSIVREKSRLSLEEGFLRLIELFRDSKNLNEFETIDVGEIDLMSNDNEYIPFRVLLTPLTDSGHKNAILGVLSDLRMQRRLDRLKADFNSMIVHDLRSPLNIVQGYIDIVRNQVVGTITEEQADLLMIAKENSDKVLKLIDNFLTASKMEAGSFDLQVETQSLNALIESIHDYHQVILRDKKLSLVLALDPNLSLLSFDRMRIEQVMNNYLSNAIKFTPPGGKITVSTRLAREKNDLTGQELMTVHVCVADTGVGIPANEIDKIFKKYEQTEAGKDAMLKGTGLGLAICKEIVSLHKGRVWVTSQPGDGSSFYFSLPIIPITL